MRVWILLPALLALAMLGITGCGGGSGDESTAAAPLETTAPAQLSKEDLITQGDAICAEVNAAVGTVSSTSGDATSQTTQAADLYSGMVDRLKSLGTPDDTAGYPEFIAAAEALSQAESDVSLAAERGESAGLESAESEASSARTSFQLAAQSYGFEDCGEGPSAPVPTTAAPPTSSESAPTESAEEEAPAPEAEAAPEETGGAGSVEAGGAGSAGGGTAGGGTEGGGGSSSGGIGPG
jgi:hypothetical protein